jgi:ABC-2 type transport system permease protein
MSEPTRPDPVTRGGRAMRLAGLVRKEFLQIVRDPSSIAIAFVLPIALLLLFGYGVSLDSENVPVAVVVEDPGADAAEFTAALYGSRYFAPVRATDMAQAVKALLAGRVDAIVHLRANFAAELRRSDGAPIQVIVNGVNANSASIVEGSLEGAWAWT